MKKTTALSVCLLIALSGAAGSAPMQAAPSYTLAFSTFIGGSDFEQIRDITVDGSGNIYVVGGTASVNYPRTVGGPHAGWLDVFVTKLSPSGTLLWSRLIGGPNYDRAYGVELDPQGNVCVTGRAGPGFPIVGTVFQPNYGGYNSGAAYGDQNAFILKLRPDGTTLWSSYFGIHEGNRDLAVDANGDIYVYSSSYNAAGLTNPTSWFTNAFQPTPNGGAAGNDILVGKVRGDGSAVLWATYLGGSGTESGKGSIRVDSSGRPIVLTNTNSTNIPLANAYQNTFRGVQDFYLAKLAADGSSLVFGTYFGGSDSDWCETHHLELDGSGNIFISGITHSADLPVSPDAFQTQFGGINGQQYFHATGDAYVAKFSPTGALLRSTYLGGRYGDGAQGLGVDAQGNVYFTGGTVSDDLPLTPGAYQTTMRGTEDFMAVKMSSDLKQVLYSTYLGSSVYDEGRAAWADSAGNFYVAGETIGADWPVLNAVQATYSGGGDNTLAKFTPASTTPGSLRLSASTYSVGEGAGHATITVNRVNGSSGQVTVNYATSNGTAAAGSDYTTRSGTLTWPAGDSAPKTFTVPILNDTAVESNETVTVTLSAPTGGATLGTPATATLTIIDNDSTNVPAPPSGVAAMAGDGRVTIAWAPSNGATSYKVYSGTSPGVTRANGTPHANVMSPFVLTGLPNGTAQYFVVTASNATGESAESAEVSATPSSGGWPIADADGDGYSDAAETAAGSDPANSASRPGDTDGDGLGDAWETANFGGLAQNAAGDPDGDGANNFLEFNAGTDPNLADTDGDSLSDLQEIQGGTDPLTATGASTSGGNEGCGATGMEVLLVPALFRRRTARRGTAA